jgi:hypothetical protein
LERCADVYLCDDDGNILTDFPYAYRVVYTNSDNTNATLEFAGGIDYYRMMAGFEIPSSGAASETSYQS